MLDIAGNKFSYKALAKVAEELLDSAKSGILTSLDISDTVHDENGKQK